MESIKLKYIGKNLLDLLNIVGENSNFLRLLYYNTDDPYSMQTLDRNGNIVTQNNISLDDVINNENLILGDVDINILKDAKTIGFLHPYRGTFSKDKATNKDVFVLDVCYPYIYYILKGLGEIRPYSIGYEFFKNIDRQNVAGIGKVFLDSYVQSKLDNSNYGCVSFLFTIGNSTPVYNSI